MLSLLLHATRAVLFHDAPNLRRMTSVGDKLTFDEVELMLELPVIKEAAVSPDGKVNYAEFLKVMMKQG